MILVICNVALPVFEITSVLCALAFTCTLLKFKLPPSAITPPVAIPVPEAVIVFVPPSASEFTVTVPL